MIGKNNLTNKNKDHLDIFVTVLKKKMLGCCIPRDLSKQRNKMINDALERDRKEMNAESKLLLLGKKIIFIWNFYF